ncbi:tetratricopeptide repeat protein [Thermodesulfobacteriota bacterium]
MDKTKTFISFTLTGLLLIFALIFYTLYTGFMDQAVTTDEIKEEIKDILVPETSPGKKGVDKKGILIAEKSGPVTSVSDMKSGDVKELPDAMDINDAVNITLLKILEENNVPVQAREAQLQEQAVKYGELEEWLAEQEAEDPLAVQVRNSLEQGDFETAEKLLLKSFEKNIESLPEKQEQAAKDAFGLGSIRDIKLDYTEAENYYAQAVRLDPDNSDYPNWLGCLYYKLEDYPRAKDNFEKALAIDLKVYNNNHPDLIALYSNLGETWRSLRGYEKARDYFKKSLEVGFNLYGEQHSAVSASYDNLGLTSMDLADYKSAVDYFKKALEISLELYGDKDPEAAVRYNNLGIACNKLGEYENAVEYYKKALDIDLKFYGEDHPEVAIRYNNIGAALNHLGKNKEGREYLEKALAIFTTSLGESHPYTKTLKAHLEKIENTEVRGQRSEDRGL